MKSPKRKSTLSSRSTTASTSLNQQIADFKTTAGNRPDALSADMQRYMMGDIWATTEQLRQVGKQRAHGLAYGSGMEVNRVFLDEASSFATPSSRAWSKAFEHAYGTMSRFYAYATQAKRRQIEAATEVLSKKTSKAGRMAARVVAARVMFMMDMADEPVFEQPQTVTGRFTSEYSAQVQQISRTIRNLRDAS